MISLHPVTSVAEPRPNPDGVKLPKVLSKPIGSELLLGVVLGVATQLLFLWTAWHLFLFLRYGGTPTSNFSVVVDISLALFFAWPHSLLLLPSVQKSMKKHIPAGWIGLVHCIATCISLVLLFSLWSTSPNYLWRLEGWSATLVLTGFYASWIGLFYSLYLTGMGYQTGLIPWWCWLRGKELPRRAFVTYGAFRFMRHPVYFSFLGLIWFTPEMSLDHAIMTFLWTIYIYVGSFLKDRRMTHFLGETYREYARRVSGFPLIGFGPWGKLS